MNKTVNIPRRSVVYIKDVMVITGRKRAAATSLYMSVFHHYGKTKGQFVTFTEFCAFTGMDEERLCQQLRL